MSQAIEYTFLTRQTATRLKLRRLALGLSQADVAEEIGIHQVTLGRWEKAQTFYVESDKLSRWRDAVS